MSSVDYYNKNANRYFRETFNADLSEVYPPFLERLPENAHILDAGCGSGRDSLFFLKKGYRVTAIDASKEMAKLASRAIRQKVLPITFEKIDYKNEFDGIWACALVLHIPNHRIDRFFSSILKALKPGGILYVSFKYGDKEIEENGRFFNFYDEKKLIKTLGVHIGLKPLQLWITGDARPNRIDELWLNAVIEKQVIDQSRV